MMNKRINTVIAGGMLLVLGACGGGPTESPIELLPDINGPVVDGSGTLEFRSVAFNIQEGAGRPGGVIVTRTGGASGIVTAKISLTAGTADAVDDFGTDDLTVRFGNGDAGSRLVRLPIVPDTEFETDETLTATLHSPEGCAIVGGQDETEITIINDDQPREGLILFTSDGFSIDESAGSADVTVERTGSDVGQVVVNVGTADGTATAQDYVPAFRMIVFVDGDSGPHSVTVPILDDAEPEDDQTVLLSIEPGSIIYTDNIGNPATATLTILDNDQPAFGTLQFTAASYTVAEAVGIASVELARVDGNSGAVTVDIETENVSAIAGEDYDALTSTIAFADGDDAPKNIGIAIIDDQQDEGDHYFNVLLSNATGGATLGSPDTVPVVIVDDDGPPPLPPAPPTLTVSGILKQLVFDWPTVQDATFYRLFMNADGVSGYAQVGNDIALGSLQFTLPVAVHLLDWNDARFLLQACNSAGCTDSNEVSVDALMLAGIGFFKASNTEGRAQRAPDGGDLFGWATALSGDGRTLAVTAYDEDSNAVFLNGDQNDNSESDSGAVYVFRSGPSGWYQEAYVKAPNTDNFDRFGSALALSDDGDTLLITATGEGSNATGIDGDQSNNTLSNSGAAYVYQRSGNVWSLQGYLKASNTDAQDNFGAAAALAGDGNLLAIGAPGESSNATGIDGDQANNDASVAGAVYVFSRSGTSWLQQAYLKASNGEAEDRFGTALAMSSDGSMLAVSATGEDSSATGVGGDQSDNSAPGTGGVIVGTGAVYTFTNSSGQWAQDEYFKASNTDADDRFGGALALSTDGSMLAVGARREDSPGTGVNSPTETSNSAEDAGAVYVYDRTNGLWQQSAYIKASNTVRTEFFGTALDLSSDGQYLVVGAEGEDSMSTGINGNETQFVNVEVGAAYLFRRESPSAAWTQISFVKAPNTDQSGSPSYGRELSFGNAVSISGDGQVLAIGAYRDSSDATGINGDQVNENARLSGAVYVY